MLKRIGRVLLPKTRPYSTHRPPSRSQNNRPRKAIIVRTNKTNNPELQAASSDAEVIPFPNHKKWGKAGCSDMLANVGAELTAAQFKALFYLTRHVGEKSGHTFVSHALIADESGMDRRQVDRCMTELTKAGIVRRKETVRCGRKQFEYWLAERDEDDLGRAIESRRAQEVRWGLEWKARNASRNDPDPTKEKARQAFLKMRNPADPDGLWDGMTSEELWEATNPRNR
jgi:hypothetical protein